MTSLAEKLLPPQPDISGRLAHALARVRWVVIGVLALLSLAEPLPTRADLPMWAIILLFGGYNLLVELLRTRLAWLHSFARVAFLDLPVTTLLYSFGVHISGPLFSLLVLTLFCAASSTTLRGSIVYTVAVMAVVAALAPTFPLWVPDRVGWQQLAARLIVLAVVGTSATIIMQQLWLKGEEVESGRDETRRLQELDRIRSDFISTVSHDIGTPLTATRAVLGLLEESAAEKLSPDERELLEIARRNTERLGLMINDLLGYNQLEAGTLRLERELLDLRTIVMNALPTVQPLIREKEQVLEVHLPEPLWCEGDARQLEQVVVNVLANAYHHTPHGTRIVVSGRSTDGEVLLSVSDDGPGIPPEEAEAIFRRFHRLPSGASGSGLGLAIARGIVEIHGSRIWVESRPGGGATFYVALPHRSNGGTP